MRSPASPSYLQSRAVLLTLLVVLAVSHGGTAGARIPSNDLDPTFGRGGIVKTNLPSQDERVTDLALQADGKILAMGFADGFALLRYLPDGELDPEFRPLSLMFGDQVAVQPDGKIVVGGGSPKDRFAVARLNADGSVDTTFGHNGRVMTPFPDDVDLNDLAVQSDGKIVAAGSPYLGHGFVFARYLSDGRLDPSFGSNGRVIITLRQYLHTLADVAIQPDGKIVANGELSEPRRDRLGLVRLDVDGTLDPTFDGDGIVVTQFEEGFSAVGLVIQPDGRIVSAGSYAGEFGVARHLTDGTLDHSFGESGLVHTSIIGLSDLPHDVDVQPNGLIVVAGSAADEGDLNHIAVVWYRPDGSLYSEDSDPLFGVSSFGGAVAVQPDGKAIGAGGGGPTFYHGTFGLARFVSR